MTRAGYMYCDLETYSEVSVNCGAHRYAEKAEVLLFAWAKADAPVQVWDVTTKAPMPAELAVALADQRVITVWHNGGMFDSVVLQHALGIHIAPERMEDTMVQALAHGLPGSLGDLCAIFRLTEDESKDKTGRQLVQLFCKPRPANCKLRRATAQTHKEQWAQFIAYAARDIQAMRALHRRMPRWNLTSQERELWYLDQRINRRGIYIDVALAHAAIRAVDEEKVNLAERVCGMTGGEVASASRRDAMLRHIAEVWGIALPDMRADTLERRIADPDTPQGLRELLGVRLSACTTSVSKYKKLISCISPDNRLRGTQQFCGASRTGRQSGRYFQPQNLPRPDMPQTDIDLGIRALKAGYAPLLYEPMQLTSNALRGVIVPPQGCKLVVSDLSNIEGRVLAWLAGEQWKLQAFRDSDTGHGEDLYKLTYARAFNIAPQQVTPQQRQTGKVMELGLGYGGGVAAFLAFATAYGMSLAALADAFLPVIPPDIRHEASGWYNECVKTGNTCGLSKEQFIACDALKRLWRITNPRIAAFWKAVQYAAERALGMNGTEVKEGRVTAVRHNAWLRLILPSGRSLCYPGAAIDETGAISYYGINPYSRKWQRMRTYGGKLAENICQAVARDILMAALPGIEKAGYRIVLTVHDEVITEAPDTPEYNAQALSALLAAAPGYAPDLPLAAAGFEGKRYRKG